MTQIATNHAQIRKLCAGTPVFCFIYKKASTTYGEAQGQGKVTTEVEAIAAVTTGDFQAFGVEV